MQHVRKTRRLPLELEVKLHQVMEALSFAKENEWEAAMIREGWDKLHAEGRIDLAQFEDRLRLLRRDHKPNTKTKKTRKKK